MGWYHVGQTGKGMVLGDEKAIKYRREPFERRYGSELEPDHSFADVLRLVTIIAVSTARHPGRHLPGFGRVALFFCLPGHLTQSGYDFPCQRKKAVSTALNQKTCLDGPPQHCGCRTLWQKDHL